ncbi:MAG TPA: CBS domain-containing protein, partial [Parasegetibacter sp.]
YLRVQDLYVLNAKPQVKTDSTLKEVINEISAKRLGATAVIDNDNNITGIITDGDVRRMLENDVVLSQIKAGDIMTKTPISIHPSALAVNALELMRNKNISQLIVEDNRQYLGILHIHDLIKEGLI